jgi:hypothetical protein
VRLALEGIFREAQAARVQDKVVLTVTPLLSFNAARRRSEERTAMSQLDRRTFLIRGLQIPAAILAADVAVGACVNPDELSDSVQSMRESLEYTDAAADAKQACNGCALFMPAKDTAGCGHCEVLAGPVNAKGHCVSWTKRS